MPVFPRSPKDSRKIVKMKRGVPVAQLVSLEAAGVYAGGKKEPRTSTQTQAVSCAAFSNTFSFGLSQSCYAQVSLINDKY